MNSLNKTFLLNLSLLTGLFVAVHTWMFLFFQQWAVLGFDTGFYRRYVLEPMTSIPHASVAGLDHTVILPRVFIDLVRLTGLSTDIVLYGSYLLAAILLLTSFYFWVSHIFDKKSAILAVVLLLLSPVYFHGYWYFLLKNFLALAIFFWLLISLKKKSWLFIIILSVALPITHQSTTVIAGIIIFLIAAISWYRKENWYFALASWFIITSFYLFYHPTVAAKLSAPPTAIFLDWPQFILFAWPLLLLTSYIIYRSHKFFISRIDLIACLFVMSLFLAFSLPYYERIFFFVIFPLCAVCGYGLTKLNFTKNFITGGIIILVLFWGFSIKDYSPYFSSSNIAELKVVEQLDSNAHLIVPNYLAPWAHGYTLAEVYAPGVFKDPFSSYDWELYWSHQSQISDRTFLDTFPQPLYIYAPGRQNYFLPGEDCIKLISGALYEYTCYNKRYEAPGVPNR